MKPFWHLSNESDNIAVIEQGGNRYTYTQMQKDIDELKNKLKTDHKKLIVILTSVDYKCLVAYLAALQNRDAVMLLNADLDPNLLKSIIQTYQPSYIFGEGIHDGYERVQDGIYRRTLQPQYEIHPELAVLLSTSGTTGSVKFVRLSERNIQANAESISSYLNISIEDRGLANLPLHYSYGLSVINSHLHVKAIILLSKESVLSKELWEFVKKEQATSIAGVPYTYQMLNRIGFTKMDLPSIHYFSQAGGRLEEKLAQVFGQYAKDTGKKFYMMYGQTEATARISYVPPESLLEKPDSIGKAIPGGKLSLNEGTGELIYRGPNVMLGYATSVEDLAKGDELNGELHTGDLAQVDEEGFYFIKGRMKRFIKLFGQRINLDEIERQIESALQINAFCVGNDDRLVVIVENGLKIEQVQSFIHSQFKLHRSAYRVKSLDEIPRLKNGKVDYNSLKDLVL